MLPGKWGIGVGVGIRKSIIGRFNGTGRGPKPRERSAVALWQVFPGAWSRVALWEYWRARFSHSTCGFWT